MSLLLFCVSLLSNFQWQHNFPAVESLHIEMSLIWAVQSEHVVTRAQSLWQLSQLGLLIQTVYLNYALQCCPLKRQIHWQLLKHCENFICLFLCFLNKILCKVYSRCHEGLRLALLCLFFFCEHLPAGGSFKLTPNYMTVLFLVSPERHDLLCPDYSGHWIYTR